MQTGVLRACAAAVGVLVGAPVCDADVVRLIDGTTLRGDILAENDEAIAFCEAGDETVRVVAQSDIQMTLRDTRRLTERGRSGEPFDLDAAVDALAPTGDAHRIELRGVFGEEILAAGVEAAVKRALERGARQLIFVIESDGGVVQEATAIAEVIEDAGDRATTVAVVERGLSASIWPTFACERIFMTEGAVLGAAVAYTHDTSTGEIAVDAKFNSALAAELAAMAERQGHDGELARAMVIPEIAIWATVEADGSWTVRAARPDLKDSGVRTIVEQGEVLTLTAPDAERLGLASRIDEVTTEAIGLAVEGEAWVDAGDGAMMGMQAVAQDADRLRDTAPQIFEKAMAFALAAAEYDPHRYSYATEGAARRLTAESRRQWTERSDAAIGLLHRAERDLRRLHGVLRRAEDKGIDPRVVVGFGAGDIARLHNEVSRDLGRIRAERDIEQLPLDAGLAAAPN
ncbi:MAG: hypothetical protein ACF8QF_01595 [Phycisphaerales bacterium]